MELLRRLGPVVNSQPSRGQPAAQQPVTAGSPAVAQGTSLLNTARDHASGEVHHQPASLMDIRVEIKKYWSPNGKLSKLAEQLTDQGYKVSCSSTLLAILIVDTFISRPLT